MMITHKTTILAISMAVCVFTACKKKDKSDPTPAAPAGPVTCKVNGTDWTSVKESQSLYVLGDTVNGTNALLDADTLTISAISISGTDTSGLSFYVVLDSDRLGSYTITPATQTGGMYFPKMTQADLFNTIVTYSSYISGNVKITEFDATNKTFSGEFTLSMDHPDPNTKDYILTDGRFNHISIH